MLGVNPLLMLLSPWQRRPLQPRRVPVRVAGRGAQHDHAHPLLALPALWRDDRSWPGKGTDPGGGLSTQGWGTGTAPALPELAWPPQPAAALGFGARLINQSCSPEVCCATLMRHRRTLGASAALSCSHMAFPCTRSPSTAS